MIKRIDQQFIVVLATITLLVGFFSFSSVNALKMGNGFGRDTTLIVESRTPEELEKYIEGDFAKYHDIEFKQISNSTKYIKISGIDNLDELSRQLTRSVPNSYIKLSATFGTLTKLNNTESFTKLGLIVMFLLLFIYFVYRYRYLGWILSLTLVFSLSLSFIIMDRLGFVFTFLLWLFIVLLCINYTYQFSNLFNEFIGKTLYKVVQESKKLRDSINKVVASNIVLFLLGALVLLIMDSAFKGIGMLSILFSSISSLFLVIGYKYSIYQFSNNEELEKSTRFLIFENTRIINFQSPIKASFNIFSKLMTVMMIIMVILGIVLASNVKYETNYSSQGLVVLKDNIPENYIELEADFIRFDIYDQQLYYEVSEQGQTWIYLHSENDDQGFKLAASTFSERSGIGTETFYLKGNTFPLLKPSTLFILGILMLFLFVSTSKIYNTRRAFSSLFLSSMVVILFMGLVWVWGVPFSNQVIVILLMVPVLLQTYNNTLSSSIDLKIKKNYKSLIMYSLALNSIIMLIVAVPMIVIAPSKETVDMIFLMGLIGMALYMGIYIQYRITYRKKGG